MIDPALVVREENETGGGARHVEQLVRRLGGGDPAYGVVHGGDGNAVFGTCGRCEMMS